MTKGSDDENTIGSTNVACSSACGDSENQSLGRRHEEHYGISRD